MKIFKEYGKITIGLFLVAVSIEFFLAPNQIAAGGVTGLAIVVNSYIPFISIGLLVLIMNAILFIIAFIIIGNKFGAKTIYSSLTLSGIIWLMDQFITTDMALTSDLMLAAIFGTITSGIGMALVFNENASTGGTDILAKILHKFFHTDIGKSLLAVDFIVTILGALTFGIDQGLYALLAVIINGLIIDYAIDGFNMCKQIFIITSQPEAVGNYILKKLDRSYTKFYGKGGYSDKEVDILYTILSRKQYIILKKYIMSTDKKAFIAVNDSHEVLGEGFGQLDED
ncbi:YitT family protein [Clostridium thermarum]|uniref:YitT family protein n=1 Tax=Clostridium thermarum TaxID=1716543 RepID=UPI00111E7461|nr:YitT family protein [Clostridium thermarum]